MTVRKTEYEALVNAKAHLERQVEYLPGQMRLARHTQFGASSEKSEYLARGSCAPEGYDAQQLGLFNEAGVFADATPEPEPVEIEKHYHKRTRLTADKQFDNLLVEVVEHTLPEGEQICLECGRGWRLSLFQSDRTGRNLILCINSCELSSIIAKKFMLY